MKLEQQAIRWKALPGFKNLYDVSDNGCVRSYRRSGSDGRVIKQHSHRGYYQVWLSKHNKIKRLSVHRAVLMAFCRLPKQQEVCNHKDGNRVNNRIENLEWVSKKINEWHKRDILGIDSKGCRNGNWGYRHSKIYPSANLRNVLCKLGVPRNRHNIAELGEMLPQFIKQKSTNFVLVMNGKDHNGEFRVAYLNSKSGIGPLIKKSNTEADARAAMLIHLNEKGILKP